MERLSFIELGMNTAPVIFAFQIAENENLFSEFAVFLERSIQHILPRIGLQLTDEEGGADPAELERPG